MSAATSPMSDAVTIGPGAVPQLTRDAAERLTAQIVGHLQDAVDLIVRAAAGRAWIALGDPSWEAYCRTRLKVNVPREHRAGVATAMRLAGMSANAIGPATGWSPAVIRNDLRGTEAELADVIGIDGRRYPAPARKAAEVEAAEVVAVPKTQRVVMLLLEVGPRGLTPDELGARMTKGKQPGSWHWGASSGLLSKLAKQQRVVVVGTRGRHAVYVHPTHAGR